MLVSDSLEPVKRTLEPAPPIPQNKGRPSRAGAPGLTADGALFRT